MSETAAIIEERNHHLRNDISAILKFTLFFITSLLFIFIQLIFVSWIPSERMRLKMTLRNIQVASQLGVLILGLKIKRVREEIEGELLVSNHLSYLDILVLASTEPALFITSREIAEVFFLGTLTQLGGCFFVERRKNLRTPEIIEKELAEIHSKIDQDFKVFLFPEGTSSNGDTVLPFKAHFFQVAIDASLIIGPRVIRYTGENRDRAPWFGKMTFADHLFSICREKSIEVEMKSLPPVHAEDYSSRFTLAEDIQRMIVDAYEKD